MVGALPAHRQGKLLSWASRPLIARAMAGALTADSAGMIESQAFPE